MIKGGLGHDPRKRSVFKTLHQVFNESLNRVAFPS